MSTSFEEKILDIFSYNGSEYVVSLEAATKYNISFSTNKIGYTRVRIDGQNAMLHRVVWFLYNHDWPKDCVDHIDGNPKNNSIENLREATHQQNMANSKGKNRWKRYRKTKYGYVTMISCNKQHYYLGTYEREEQAAYAYNVAAKMLFGNYAKLNDIGYQEKAIEYYIIRKLIFSK